MGGNSGSNSGDVFDVRRVRRLVELMHEFELAEIDLRQGEQRICLRKDQDSPASSAHLAAGVHAPPPPYPVPPYPVPAYSGHLGGSVVATHFGTSHGEGFSGEAGASSGSASSTEPTSGRYVVSPMVGTFYAAANPDAPPFVKVGDQVGPESIVCIIEAMKVFNEIPAECSGKVVSVLVETGDAVEFGQKLFRVE